MSADLYDLVLKGGRVVDPASGLNGVSDVAVSAGRIAAIAPDIQAAKAAKKKADLEKKAAEKKAAEKKAAEDAAAQTSVQPESTATETTATGTTATEKTAGPAQQSTQTKEEEQS